MKNQPTESYILASSKEWNRKFFSIVKEEILGNWLWISTQDELELALKKISPRYIFFLHWNWVVPQSIWEPYECVCFHMTNVPYGRGGSPLQNLIISGKTETKLSALRMIQEMDAGPVYIKKMLDLSGNAQQIYVRAGQLSVEIIKWIVATNPEPVPQEGHVVKFKRRTPEQSCIPKSGNIVSVYDFIRMLDADGYPHAFLDYGNYRFEFRNVNKHPTSLSADVKITFKN